MERTLTIDAALDPVRRRLADSLSRAARLLPVEPALALEELFRFASDLRRRIRWEEEVLFPAARRSASPVRICRLEAAMQDHEQILRGLAAIEAALRAKRRGAAALEMERLGICLRGHNFDEARGLCTELDRELGEAERLALLEAYPDLNGPVRTGGDPSWPGRP